VFDVYSTSVAARVVALGAGPTVTTRHGLVLLTTAADAAPTVDRLLVPGVRAGGVVDPSLARWADASGLPVELLHGDLPAGQSGFDAALRDLAAHADRPTARATAKLLEYPAAHLALDGAAWPWRPVALLTLTLAAAVGAGFLPTAVRWAARRRAAADVSGAPS
jgi:hypothetical protein